MAATPDASTRRIGSHIAAVRRDREISVRELARLSGLTPSSVSQIENDKINPSVGSLYRLAQALDVPVDRFFRPGAGATPDLDGARSSTPGPAPHDAVPGNGDAAAVGVDAAVAIVRRADRRGFELEGGVRWELVRPREQARGDRFEIIDASYPAGSASAPTPIAHGGHEYGVVTRGVLDVEVDGEVFVLRRGDSIAFSSGRPHRLVNRSPELVEAFWLVFGRAEH